MQVEITASYRGREQDVSVEAPPSATLAEVLPAIAAAVGAPAGEAMWRGAELLAPDATPAGTRLRVGALVTLGPRPAVPRAEGVLALLVAGGPSAGRSVPLARGRVLIGRAADCDVVLDDGDVSRRHALLEVGATEIVLRDLDSTNGTHVDGQRVTGAGARLRAGDTITLGDSVLTLVGPGGVPASCRLGDDGTVVLLRSPRPPAADPGVEIAMPTRGGGHRPRGVQWLGALVPAVGAGLFAWLSGSPQFLLFALLSPLMVVSTAVGDRVHWRRERRRAARSYRRRRAAAERAVRTGLARELAARRAAAPDPATVRQIGRLPGRRLWERRRDDADLLRVRLGLADLPAALTVRTESSTGSAGVLRAVPLCADLRAGPLGIVGPPGVTAALGRWIVGQLTVLHAPTDVELVLLLDDERAADWTWARWLPHLRGRVAATAAEVEAVTEWLAALVDQRAGRSGPIAGDSTWRGPWTVLVLDRASRLREAGALPRLLERARHVGVTAVCVDADAGALPPQCATVVRVCGSSGTRVTVRSRADPAEVSAVADQVSRSWAAGLARELAPIREAGAHRDAAVPDRCDLLDALALADLDPAALHRRWAASTGGACATLGRAGDGWLDVDLARDGPHALVAGTTGSGKSELLQALVAGLATNHAPDELNVLLVDYKGGAAFAECAELPHTAGLVTDLDQHGTQRALRALSGELRRRERLFAEAGVSDLAGYRATGMPEPVPRLVIVVDEFAALAEELPTFLRGLVAVAQRGRSLGVHLVLATQRPGSAVSAEIRANTALRVALRVTGAGESADVIDAPVAAAIASSTPGRGYLRRGATLTAFQAAFPSSTARPDRDGLRVTPLGPWRRRISAATGGQRTQLSGLVAALRRAAEAAGRASARAVWLPALPDELPRLALPPAADSGTVVTGLLDLPDEQRRAPLAVELGAGPALLICGAPRTGRSTALAALAVGAATQLAPADLHVHVVDAAGALAAALRALPHCGTVLGPDAAGLAVRLLTSLEAEAAARLAATAGAAGRPRLLLLVDSWERLVAALPDLDAARCAELITELTRMGPAAGLTVAVAADRGALAPRFAGAFGERILLRFADRGDFALAGLAARDVPTSLPPGRGVRAADGTVLQLAHAGLDAAALAATVSACAAQWPRPGRRSGAIVIRPLPTRVALTELAAPPGRFALGVAGDDAAPVSIDPFSGTSRLLVAGPPRSGRSTVLRVLARQAHAAGIATFVAAPPRSPLAADAAQLGIGRVDPADNPAPATGWPEPTLLLVDDCEAFRDTPAGDRLSAWAAARAPGLAVVAAGRTDELVTSYRGVAAEVRRSRCGILLRPGPVDGELLGVRLPRPAGTGPPGRGVAVGEPAWGEVFANGEPVPIQVAAP